MLPNYIQEEITRRLSTSDKPAQFAKALGIDVAAALAPRPSAAEAAADLHLLTRSSQVIRGAVEFDVTIELFGIGAVRRGRTVYATTLELDCVASRLEMLIWDADEPAPEWISIDDRMLPADVRLKINDLIEEQVQVGKPIS
jgi:hypothetical protein